MKIALIMEGMTEKAFLNTILRQCGGEEAMIP
jgi:hypothetical protein